FALKAQAKLIAKFFPEKPKEDSSQWKPEVVQNDPPVHGADVVDRGTTLRPGDGVFLPSRPDPET
ncbi:MAG: hypothetical protein U9R74_09085, partial [Pseudomonadota bacterium]|nr:hypothetical protein [Pseudomonadota bacterium]